MKRIEKQIRKYYQEHFDRCNSKWEHYIQAYVTTEFGSYEMIFDACDLYIEHGIKRLLETIAETTNDWRKVKVELQYTMI